MNPASAKMRWITIDPAVDLQRIGSGNRSGPFLVMAVILTASPLLSDVPLGNWAVEPPLVLLGAPTGQ
jgi:hypothetical protein